MLMDSHLAPFSTNLYLFPDEHENDWEDEKDGIIQEFPKRDDAENRRRMTTRQMKEIEKESINILIDAT